jgi:hypothetical protein
MIDRLEQYLIWLKTQGEFIRFSEFKQKFEDSGAGNVSK